MSVYSQLLQQLPNLLGDVLFTSSQGVRYFDLSAASSDTNDVSSFKTAMAEHVSLCNERAVIVVDGVRNVQYVRLNF